MTLTNATWRVLFGLVLAATLLPPVLLVVGGREREPEGTLPGAVEGRLQTGERGPELALYGRYQAWAQLRDLDGNLRATLRARPDQPSVMPPLLHQTHVLYLIGQRTEPVVRAALGRLDLRLAHATPRVLKLPAPADLTFVDGHVSVYRAAAPLALDCPDGTVLLRLTGGSWAVLDGPRRAGSAAGSRAPRVTPPLASLAACAPFVPIDYQPAVPLGTALVAELSVAGRTLTASAPSLPPTHVVAIDGRRERYFVVQPPRGVPTLGSVMARGPWVLFHGFHCELRELHLTLASFADGGAQHSRWSKRIVLAPPSPCASDAPIRAAVCKDSLEVTAGATRLHLDLANGSPSTESAFIACQPLAQFVEGPDATWGGARLVSGPRRFRIIPAGSRAAGRQVVRAETEQRVLWEKDEPSPAYLLGTTATELLLVRLPETLALRSIDDGALRLSVRVPDLRDAVREEPARAIYLGSAAGRGIFLLGSTKDWLVPVETTRLVIYDGKRVKVIK